MRESLEWYTDLMESKNGTEQPIQLRSAPRQFLSYNMPEGELVRQSTFNTQYGALSEQWAVPIWGEAQYVGALSFAATTISLDVDPYDFRDASLAFIFQSPTKYQLVEISTVGSDVLNLTTAIQAGGFTRAYVMPCRVGRVATGFQRGGIGFGNTSEVSFDILDNIALDDGGAPTQFLGNDIYFEAPLMDGDLDDSVFTKTDKVDYDLGERAWRYPWTYTRVGRTNRYLAEGATEIRALRQFFFRRMGKYRRFWEPSFLNDLRRVSTGTLTTTLDVSSDNIKDWTPARTHIAIELDDGSWLARTITGSTQFSTTVVRLTVATLGGINASRIRRISWLGLKRLDTDRIEFNWIGGGVVQAAATIVEITP